MKAIASQRRSCVRQRAEQPAKGANAPAQEKSLGAQLHEKVWQAQLLKNQQLRHMLGGFRAHLHACKDQKKN